MEIERKFLINSIPGNLQDYKCADILQGYLNRNPVVRIRKWNDSYILTYKRKKNKDDPQEIAIQNEEIEMPLNEAGFWHLAEKIDYNMIHKKRYIIPLEQGYKAELDIFEGKLEGLIFAEVEFPDKESAGTFIKPEWMGDEVTFDSRYRNSHLAKLDSGILN